MLQLRWHFCGASFDCLPSPFSPLIWVLQVLPESVLVAGWQVTLKDLPGDGCKRRICTMLTEVQESWGGTEVKDLPHTHSIWFHLRLCRTLNISFTTSLFVWLALAMAVFLHLIPLNFLFSGTLGISIRLSAETRKHGYHNRHFRRIYKTT